MIKEIFKTKELRQRIIFDLWMLIIIRMVTQIAIPGIRPDVLMSLLGDTSSFNLLNSFTGGSVENFGILALSIGPYITASIIIELMTIAIPVLEEIKRDGEEGRKKITQITRFVTIGLSLLQSIAMGVTFTRNGYATAASIPTMIACLTAGSCFLMWLGDQISEYGIGNGISIILVINILSRVPSDLSALYEQFVKGQTVAKGVLAAIVIFLIIFFIMVFTVVLNGAVRNIPVQYSGKVGKGDRFLLGRGSQMPVKINTAGVIPVIFASSILSFPAIILQLIGKTPSGVPGQILSAMNQGNWFDADHWYYTIGWILYAILIVFFAYFYTSITFNPMEISDDLRKSGAVIPGIRPGHATKKYLEQVLNEVILIGAIGLLLVCTIPMVLNGVFHASVSFGGTSLFIICSVLGSELMDTIKAQLSMRSVKAHSFLKDKTPKKHHKKAILFRKKSVQA